MMPIAEGYHYGFSGPPGSQPVVGAHPVERELPPFTRRGLGGAYPAIDPIDPPDDPVLVNGDVLELQDSRTYALTIHRGDPLTNAAIQGRGDERPYLLLSTDDGDTDHVANLVPADPTDDPVVPPGTRTFRIEGVWVGSDGDAGHLIVVERAENPSDTVEFDWDEIVLRQTTLDPGGVRGDETTIPAIRLLIRGRVRRLRIESCIIGSILVEQVEPCSQSGFVEELVIHDSIVDGQGFGSDPAIECTTGHVELERVTIFGNVEVGRLDATDCIIMGTLSVLNQQGSCLRFSAVSPGGSLPRTFEVFGPPPSNEEGAAGTVIEPAFFTSLRFGDPGYASPSVVAPIEITQGAESGSEMGAFSALFRPIRMASIINKVDEFKPAGIIAQYILEGEHAPPQVPFEEPSP